MTFYKYQGTGNDFILLDNREGNISLSRQQVALLCHRRFGIGADGLMLLEKAPGYDFRMAYYNSDGGESTMCGNGGRCMTAFARYLGVFNNPVSFIAIDGPHSAHIAENGLVSLMMNDVTDMTVEQGYTLLNTGSPHYVSWVKDVNKTDVVTEGRSIRSHERYDPDGINVNFATLKDGILSVRTYERGVEDETLSCGTGVTAAAIAATCHTTGDFDTLIQTPGGELRVSFTKTLPLTATNVVLTGPAIFVFKGDITL